MSANGSGSAEIHMIRIFALKGLGYVHRSINARSKMRFVTGRHHKMLRSLREGTMAFQEDIGAL